MVCSPGKEEWHCEWIGDTQKHCIKQCVLFVYTKSVKRIGCEKGNKLYATYDTDQNWPYGMF